VRKGLLVPQGELVQMVPKAPFKVLLVLRVHKEVEVIQVLKVLFKEHKAQEDLKVLKVL
jgi:hypothetical protein